MSTRLHPLIIGLLICLPVAAGLLTLSLSTVTPASAQAVAAETTEPAQGSVTGLPIPRFVSLNPKGAGAVNIRTGPGVQYPIKWVFKRPQLPVQIIAEYELWRRIKDVEGDDGWVHKSLLSGRRTGLVTERIRVLYRQPTEEAVPAFLAEPGVVGRIEQCSGDWCRMQIDQTRGWIQRDHIWGTFDAEDIND